MEKFFFNIISGRKEGFFFSFVRLVLWVLSLFYGFVVAVRRLLYSIGIKKSYRFPCRVISVGNIVAGGTGKTPLTIHLAKQFTGQKVAVVLRSYKAKATTPVLLSENPDWQLVGDEACIVSRHLPEVMVWAAKKKVWAAKAAADAGAQVIIVDDALQHLAVHSDYHVVVIDYNNPFGYGYLLPRGTLREPLSCLKRADLIVINCREAYRDTAEIEIQLRLYTQAPITKAISQCDGIFDMGDKRQELPSGVTLGLVCAIGKPEQFVQSVEKMGFEVKDTLIFPDHEAVPEDALAQFAKQMKGAGAVALLCTEKDRVKLSPEATYALPIYWLKIQTSLASPLFDQLFL